MQMSDWLLAKDQKQHCCPTCCLGFKTEPELFVHLKHTAVHQVRGTPCNTFGGSHIWCQDTLLHKLLTADKHTYSCIFACQVAEVVHVKLKAFHAVLLSCYHVIIALTAFAPASISCSSVCNL